MNLTEQWWLGAVCAQVGPEPFYGETKGSTKKAKAICARCPVIGACMEAVFVEEAGRGRTDMHGIRAGMTAYQRHALVGHLCPGCRGERDRIGSRYCSTCQPAVDSRDRSQVLEDQL